MSARRAATSKERLRERRDIASRELANSRAGDDVLACDAFELGVSPGNAVPKSLRELIEQERSRLVFADSALTCLHAALVRAEQCYGMDSSNADVVLLAQSLVREAVDRLDWVFVKPFSMPTKE